MSITVKPQDIKNQSIQKVGSSDYVTSKQSNSTDAAKAKAKDWEQHRDAFNEAVENYNKNKSSGSSFAVSEDLKKIESMRRSMHNDLVQLADAAGDTNFGQAISANHDAIDISKDRNSYGQLKTAMEPYLGRPANVPSDAQSWTLNDDGSGSYVDSNGNQKSFGPQNDELTRYLTQKWWVDTSGDPSAPGTGSTMATAAAQHNPPLRITGDGFAQSADNNTYQWDGKQWNLANG